MFFILCLPISIILPCLIEPYFFHTSASMISCCSSHIHSKLLTSLFHIFLSSSSIRIFTNVCAIIILLSLISSVYYHIVKTYSIHRLYIRFIFSRKFCTQIGFFYCCVLIMILQNRQILSSVPHSICLSNLSIQFISLSKLSVINRFSWVIARLL